jgi:predicted transcriptional regulator
MVFCLLQFYYKENIIELNNATVKIIYDDININDCLYVKGVFVGLGLQNVLVAYRHYL